MVTRRKECLRESCKITVLTFVFLFDKFEEFKVFLNYPKWPRRSFRSWCIRVSNHRMIEILKDLTEKNLKLFVWRYSTWKWQTRSRNFRLCSQVLEVCWLIPIGPRLRPALKSSPVTRDPLIGPHIRGQGDAVHGTAFALHHFVKEMWTFPLSLAHACMLKWSSLTPFR